MSIKPLGLNDTIVLNAGVHYDSTKFHLLENAVNFFIAFFSIQTMASVFYLEPFIENWHKSNGINQSCMWRCHCEFVESFCLVGIGGNTPIRAIIKALVLMNWIFYYVKWGGGVLENRQRYQHG